MSSSSSFPANRAASSNGVPAASGNISSNAESDRPAPEQPSPSFRARAADRRSVLVVDDNVDAAKTMTLLVKLKGHRCEMALDGRQAIDQARTLQPDLILLDIGMPGLDGYETCRLLRREPAIAAAKIVALTGWGQAEDRQRSEAAGFDLHLTKPVEPERIFELLQQL